MVDSRSRYKEGYRMVHKKRLTQTGSYCLLEMRSEEYDGC